MFFNSDEPEWIRLATMAVRVKTSASQQFFSKTNTLEFRKKSLHLGDKVLVPHYLSTISTTILLLYHLEDWKESGQQEVFILVVKNKLKILKGCYASNPNICMAWGWHFALQAMESGSRNYMWNSKEKSCASQNFVKCVSQSCEAHTNTCKLTFTLGGFLQCSFITFSTVILWGRITTSLFPSLHVSSHSSPVFVCVTERQTKRQRELH